MYTRTKKGISTIPSPTSITSLSSSSSPLSTSSEILRQDKSDSEEEDEIWEDDADGANDGECDDDDDSDDAEEEEEDGVECNSIVDIGVDVDVDEIDGVSEVLVGKSVKSKHCNSYRIGQFKREVVAVAVVADVEECDV